MTAKASFSRLQYYSNCPKAYKFKYIDKISELERPQSKTGEHANTRGSRIHEAADDYINGRCSDLIPELHSFKEEFASARLINLATPDLVSTEQFWTCDDTWTPTNPEYDDKYWLVTIVDLLIFTNKEKTNARVIDFKSGKIWGNEVKHATQLQLYAVAAFTRYPTLESISAELWYVDKAKKPKATVYTRDQAMRFQRYWNTRIKTMQEDTDFTAKPHMQSCMFCNYGKAEHNNQWLNKTGDCNLSMDKRDIG